MKKFLLLLLLFLAFAHRGFSQVPTYFTFDSIFNPPYICQANTFNVEVFGMRSSASVQFSSQNYKVSNDTIYARFYFVGGFGVPTTQPLYQNLVIPAPFNFGRYKIMIQGFYDGQLHQSKTSTISICSGVSGMPEKDSTRPEFKAYPNPATACVTVKHPVSNSPGALVVRNVIGNVVLNQRILRGKSETQLNLQPLPSGIYLLEFTGSSGKKSIQKIVKP